MTSPARSYSAFLIVVLGAALVSICVFGVLVLAPLDVLKPWGAVVLAAVLAAIPGGLSLVLRGADRALLRAWFLAGLFGATMALSHQPAAAESQSTVLIQIGLGLAFLAVLRGRFALQAAPHGGMLRVAALALAAMPIVPWAALGALGSWFDCLLALLYAAILAAAALLIAEPLLQQSDGVLQNGAAFSVLLFLMTWPAGGDGVGLLFFIALPPFGWALALLLARGERTAALLLIGLTAAGPLVFADPDTLAPELLAGGREGLLWGVLAAFGSAVLALPVTLLLRVELVQRRSVAAGALALAWGAVALTYVLAGQPGFYGDRLFVILKDQADLQAVARMPAFDERRVAAYRILTSHAERTQAALRRDLNGLGVPFKPYYLVNALEVQGGWPLRLWLMTRPEVDRVLPSPVLRPLPEPQSPAPGELALPDAPLWNLEMVRAVETWEELGVRGDGIVIGQSDSGVAWEHPELRAGYRGLRPDGSVDHAYAWFDPWNAEPVPYDSNGHGTHTLAIALGRRVGVAPGARWIGCANLVRNIGNAARYLDCLQFMLAPFPAGGDPLRDGDPLRSAHVLNNSWGCPQDLEGCDPNALLPAVHALRIVGIFVVASAGNEGPACSSVADPLALYDDVVSVGAVDRSRQPAFFSSVGPVLADGSGRVKPDLVAPGMGILSAAGGGGYMQASGTSQAGPHVAGAVALIWSANPVLIGDVERTEQILRDSAVPLPDAAASSLQNACGSDNGRIPNNTIGSGLIDVYHAVQLARALP